MGRLCHQKIAVAAVGSVICLAGCASTSPPQAPRQAVDFAPTSQPAASLQLDASQVRPMYRELLAVDLPAVARVASANNLEIEEARQHVAAAKGRYESSVEAILPVIAPSIALSHVEGVNQNASGTLTPVNFNTLLPAISLQWILNPGRVVYDIIASKRRLEASQQEEQAVILETTRTAAVQYYDLVLAQARLAVAHEAVLEAQELVRISDIKLHSGTGLTADLLRAQASLGAREQDQAVAANSFFQASLALSLTLRLDPTVTIVPRAEQIAQTALVRDDLSIDDMLAVALQNRPDLQSLRTLLQAAGADTRSVAWGGLGPQVQAGYSYSGIESHTSGIETGGPGRDFSLHDRQQAGIGAGLALDASTFGRIKTAAAGERSAEIDVQRQIDRTRASVVAAQQTSLTAAKIVPLAQRQVELAGESLRLAQANLQAGTMLTLDVLEAQRDLDDARLRYADSVVKYNQSEVNILAAMGVLDERSLFPQLMPPTEPTTSSNP